MSGPGLGRNWVGLGRSGWVGAGRGVSGNMEICSCRETLKKRNH